MNKLKERFGDRMEGMLKVGFAYEVFTTLTELSECVRNKYSVDVTHEYEVVASGKDNTRLAFPEVIEDVSRLSVYRRLESVFIDSVGERL